MAAPSAALSIRLEGNGWTGQEAVSQLRAALQGITQLSFRTLLARSAELLRDPQLLCVPGSEQRPLSLTLEQHPETGEDRAPVDVRLYWEKPADQRARVQVLNELVRAFGTPVNQPRGGLRRPGEGEPIVDGNGDGSLRLRHPAEIAHWYYEDLGREIHLPLPRLQQFVREFVRSLERLSRLHAGEPWPASSSVQWEDIGLSEAHLAKMAARHFVDPRQDPPESGSEPPTYLRARSRLVELSQGLGMVVCADPARPPQVLRVPDPAVLVAKLLGLKTSISGFDDLLGGGLVLGVPSAELRLDEPARTQPQGVLGVIRGRFGSGKSTLALQLAFEMARKGGVGVLMVLEQQVYEVLAQGFHYGWLPQDDTFEFVHDGRSYQDGAERLEAEDYFERRLPHALAQRKGLLYLHRPEDATLGHFQSRLQSLVELAGFGQPAAEGEQLPPLRFLIVDPLDAVQLSSQDGGQGRPLQYVRNRTEQILREVARHGMSLWVTTADVDAAQGQSEYGFMPSIGDVVIRLSTTAAGAQHMREDINAPPLRLFEFEKVRSQPFAAGVHPCQILRNDGLHIDPSGEAINRFVSWVDRDAILEETPQETVSLGHAWLDFALGTGGVRRGSVTTVMGPTGCGKTELALRYLLHDWKSTKRDAKRRSLFISFRDNWDSIADVLNGPVGRQMGFESRKSGFENYSELRKVFELLKISMINVSSPQIIDQIRRKLRGIETGCWYDRVVVDNIAYLDLTAPLVRSDNLFVPNLLKLFEREQVTPLFITSRVEETEGASRVQIQIRDASHNLLVASTGRHGAHHYVALQVKKSQQLVHLPQPMEVSVSQERSTFSERMTEIREQVREFIQFATSALPGSLPALEHLRVHLPRLADAIGRCESFLKGTNLDAEDGGEWGGRAALADLLHRVYEFGCLHHGWPLWIPAATALRAPPPSSGAPPSPPAPPAPPASSVVRELDLPPWAVALLRVAPPAPESEPVRQWRSRYRWLMDQLELQDGLCIRLHTLDDYTHPAGEDRLDSLGIGRRPFAGQP